MTSGQEMEWTCSLDPNYLPASSIDTNANLVTIPAVTSHTTLARADPGFQIKGWFILPSPSPSLSTRLTAFFAFCHLSFPFPLPSPVFTEPSTNQATDSVGAL